METLTKDLRYGVAVTSSLPFAETVERAKAALKDEGFGVLSEIDVARTLHEKLGLDVPPYLILGACNPQFAHRALQLEPDLGLLLPCNVVISERAGATRVAAVRAKAMLEVTGNAELSAVADEVDARLGRVLERCASGR